MNIILVNKEGFTFGTNKKIEIGELTNIKLEIGEEIEEIKDYPIAVINEKPELEVLINVKVVGIEQPFFGYFWENEIGWIDGFICFDEDRTKDKYQISQRCRFLTGKMICSVRKDEVLCKRRKELGECPIDKGIPGGSARDFWGMWLDKGGDKNISVEDFVKLRLSDIYNGKKET